MKSAINRNDSDSMDLTPLQGVEIKDISKNKLSCACKALIVGFLLACIGGGVAAYFVFFNKSGVGSLGDCHSADCHPMFTVYNSALNGSF